MLTCSKTEESNTYTQGVHDINQAFESPNHPGLLIHDSRGWQAGSDDELELIAQFLRHRAFQKDPAEALHVIWYDAHVNKVFRADNITGSALMQTLVGSRKLTREHLQLLPSTLITCQSSSLVRRRINCWVTERCNCSKNTWKSLMIIKKQVDWRTWKQIKQLKNNFWLCKRSSHRSRAIKPMATCAYQRVSF